MTHILHACPYLSFHPRDSAIGSLFHSIAAICARLGVPENKDLFEDFSLYDDR